MEQFYLTLFLGFASLVTVSLLTVFYKHSSQFKSQNLPPGNPGLPLIGETLEFMRTGWNGYPERFIFDRITKYSSDVFKTHLLKQPVVVMCGPVGHKFLFSNENKLVRAWWPDSINKIFPSLAITNHIEQSQKLRKVLPQFLNAEAIQRYVGIMDALAQKHFVLEWENKDKVKVFPLAKMFTFMVASRLFLNVDDPKHVDELFKHFHHSVLGIISVPINLPGTTFNRAIKASNSIRKELISIMNERKINLAEGNAPPTQDLLTLLLTCDESGGFMNEVVIADTILAIMMAGHDTASATCSFIVKYLSELPHIYDAVYQEQMAIAESKPAGDLLNWEDIQKMKYSWNVICEVMRLSPPIQGSFREAIKDFNFNGFSIPKGWKLYWSANSTHRNAQYFPEPEKFDPTRFEGKGPAPYTFVPFGGGPKLCPGKEYARLEVLVFMHNLVKRFKFEKIIANEKIVVGTVPVPAKGLPVRLYPHAA